MILFFPVEATYVLDTYYVHTVLIWRENGHILPDHKSNKGTEKKISKIEYDKY